MTLAVVIDRAKATRRSMSLEEAIGVLKEQCALDTLRSIWIPRIHLEIAATRAVSEARWGHRKEQE